MTDREPADPLTAGLQIARAFTDHGVSYALGGALAYGMWAVPRGTIDVDVNAFVRDEELHHVFDALASLGIEIDRDQARRAAADRGMMPLHWGRYRIDVFTPSIDFSWEAARTRVAIVVEDQPVYFLSAEALSVFKMLFFRPKDLVDLQRMLAVQREKLDHAYVRRHLVTMMGKDDERVRKWDELTAAA